MPRFPLIAPKRTELFGLDIGAETVKAVQLEKKRRRIRLKGYALAPLPSDTIQEGVITDPEKLAKELLRILSSSKLGKIDAPMVSASLPAAKIYTRLSTLPKLKRKELAEAARFEAEQSIPIPIDQLYLDWSVVGSYREGKEDRLDVLIAAAPRAIVESYLKFFGFLGVLPFALETELEPISRAVTVARKDSQPVVIADIGAGSTDISIVVGGRIRLAGSTPIGGIQFTEAIASTLGLSPEDAEGAKIKYGMSETGLGAKVKPALEPLLETLITEIRRMVRFYQDRSAAGTTVKEVVLSGGSSTLFGLREYLTDQLQLSVEIGNPWARIGTYPLKPISRVSAPIYTTAVGLALGGFDADS